MEKHKIIVPKDIRYVGQEDPETNERIWLDYDLNLYDFPHILNKKLTGCGFTEYCIKNKQKLILISPRKFLLENKEDQHEGEVYYVRNELETSVDYELDLNQDDLKAIDERKKTTDASENITIENLDRLKRDLRNAMSLWTISRFTITIQRRRICPGPCWRDTGPMRITSGRRLPCATISGPNCAPGRP